MRSFATPALLIGQSLELWRAPADGRREWIIEVARRQLDAGAHALDVNAGIEGESDTLIAAAGPIREIEPRAPLFLDGSVAALRAALAGVAAPVVANAVVLRHAEEAGLLHAVASARAGAVLSPRLADRSRVATAEQIAGALLEGAERCIISGVGGPFFFDCLAFPVASDQPRWRRSIEIVRMLPPGAARSLVAVGNVGHSTPPRQRPWLRLIYLALALGAGAGALILPVEETRLVEASRLIEGARAPEGDLERWLLEVARAASKGAWALPRPPASSPHALVEAWALCTA